MDLRREFVCEWLFACFSWTCDKTHGWPQPPAPPFYRTHLEIKDLKVHARVLATRARCAPSDAQLVAHVLRKNAVILSGSLLHIVGVQVPQQLVQTYKTVAAARSVFTTTRCCRVLKIQSLCQSPCNQREHPIWFHRPKTLALILLLLINMFLPVNLQHFLQQLLVVLPPLLIDGISLQYQQPKKNQHHRHRRDQSLQG